MALGSSFRLFHFIFLRPSEMDEHRSSKLLAPTASQEKTGKVKNPKKRKKKKRKGSTVALVRDL